MTYDMDDTVKELQSIRQSIVDDGLVCCGKDMIEILTYVYIEI